MNSLSECGAPGWNQSAWNVSVSARCCSAITRRDMRCVSPSPAGVSESVPCSRLETTYRSEQGAHESVELLGGHEAAALEHAHGELGDDDEVGAQHAGELGAEAVIVVEGLDLAYAAEQVEGVVVELVDVADVRVRHHDVRKPLHVPQPVRDPRRQLRPHVVR